MKQPKWLEELAAQVCAACIGDDRLAGIRLVPR
jgi:hypothetical protein